MNTKIDLKSLLIGAGLGVLLTVAVVLLWPRPPRQSPDVAAVRPPPPPPPPPMPDPVELGLDSRDLSILKQGLPETITPLTADQIANKLPLSYEFGSGKNKRVWQRMSADTWHEVYPDGFFSVFTVLGHSTVGGVEGTIVVKVGGDIARTGTLNNGSLQAFIPDKGGANMRHWYRNAARGDTQWNLSGPMQNIE